MTVGFHFSSLFWPLLLIQPSPLHKQRQPLPRGWSHNVAGGGMRGALLQPDICFPATPQRPGLTFLPNTHLEWGQG